MTAITRTINSKGVVIVRRIGKEKGNQKVVCRCPDCGKEFTTWISTFYRNINSCRCKYPASKRLYEIWVNMKTRCYNPNCYEAKYYSLKNITVCDEWKNCYKNFEKWSMENGYTEHLTIDRIDGNKGYSPENCRWANFDVQNRNKCNNINITIDGETKNIKDWCRLAGVKYKAVMSFYYRHGKDNSMATEYIKQKLLEHGTD